MKLLNPLSLSTKEGQSEPLTLAGLFRKQTAKTPNNIAIQEGDAKYSYQLLDETTEQVARSLRKQSQAGKQAVVALYFTQSMDFVIAMLAVLKAGYICVPIDLSYSSKKVKHILANCQCDLLIGKESGLKDDLPDTVSIHALNDLINDGSTIETFAWHDAKPLDTAFIMHTSGSTGPAKGVLVGHIGLVQMALEQIRIFAITDADRIMQWSAIIFDSSLAEIFTSLASGATLVTIARHDRGPGFSLPGLIRRQHISVVTISSRELIRFREKELADLRVLILAGEVLHKRHVWRFVDKITCFNGYGLTETSVCATCHRLDPQGDYGEIIPVGEPFRHLEIYVADGEMNEVPQGVAGEICIGGSGLAKAYLDNPELTIDKFVPHPFRADDILFRTGDEGYVQANGQIIVTGRKNKQGGAMSQEKSDYLKQRQDYVLEFLRNEGYRPTINADDGDIEFKREGNWYYLTIFEDDENFYRLLRPRFWPVESGEELQMVYKAASLACRGIKVAKVFVVGGEQEEDVVAVTESMYQNAEEFTKSFERLMGVLISITNEFRSEMHRLQKEAEEANIVAPSS